MTVADPSNPKLRIMQREGLLEYMAINVRELRRQLTTKRAEVEELAPVAMKAKDLVKLWNAQQKAHEAAIYARFSGAFATRAELIAFLEIELSKGTRSRSAIALDAGISAQTLANYIAKGKVRLISSNSDSATKIARRVVCTTPSREARLG